MSNKGREDPLKALSDSLRAKGGVQWRQAVLLDKRIEFFRGKDFAGYFRQHPDGMAPFVTKGRAEGEQMSELLERLVRRGIVLRCERAFKKPKPGKNGRPLKWPKKLVRSPTQNLADEGFYAWLYDRPTSPYLWIGAVLLAVVVFLACLFPLAPYSIKVSILYLSLAFIGFITVLLLVRGILAGLTWLALGRSWWLLPNLTDEEAGFFEALKPVWAFDELAEGKKPTRWWIRLLFAFGSAALLYVLYYFAPDRGSVKEGAEQAWEGMFDFLDLHAPGVSKLEGKGPEAAAGAGAKMNKPGLFDE